jgi:hypothetical protein
MRPNGRLLGNNRAVLNAFLQQHDETRKIPAHPSIITFHRQQE